MTNWIARGPVLVMFTAIGLIPPRAGLLAEEQPSTSANPLAAEEKQACVNNLKQIYEAVQAYQADHKDLPNWLSDLVPKYVADVNVLVCPVCRRTGKIEAPPLADPKIPSSYLFEFCPVPLGAEVPRAPNRTRREWKRRQMGLVGSVVPIVRCRHHDPVLNLAFDGKIYESPALWEFVVSNRVSAAQLTPARMFAGDISAGERGPGQPAGVRTYSPRDPKAGNQMLDLTSFYNAMLKESWHGNTGNDLGALPVGLQTLADITFDVRGIVQLAGKDAAAMHWPTEIKGIPVRQKCQRLHFLHAAGHGSAADEGKQIGAYVVHFASNQMRLEIPIRYGRDVRDWHQIGNDPDSGGTLTVAWRGENEVSKRGGHTIRLFLTTWTNLVPTVEIESIDAVSNMERAAPFLIAITVD